MSFVARQINLQFSGSISGPVVLKGLRCQAMISNPGGSNSYGSLSIKIYGMSLTHMNEFSLASANLVSAENYSIAVLAGDYGHPLVSAFNGHIISSYIDFTESPDVAFIVSAVSGYYEKASPSAPNTYQGAQNAEDIIKSLTTSMVASDGNKWAFTNNNAHAVIFNQYVSGSILDQITDIANIAGFPWKIENNTVSIWENTGNSDNVVIDISPQTGLVGYPSYWAQGFYIKTQFSQLITNGRKINLSQTVIPKANGPWDIHAITHELSTLTPDGTWFSNARLNRGDADYVAKN